jgi:hypothetical protein
VGPSSLPHVEATMQGEVAMAGGALDEGCAGKASAAW